ncbi:MAG: carboxypeptidase regulatory-like domain-containing protein, partial [Acidobacteriota bacterium]
TDSTGAVIPGALIHVVNQATNVVTDTRSNNVGFYQVPALFTGTYSVTVSAPNMKTYKTTIQLLVAQSAIINPSLTAGAVTQQVEVAANAVQLTTSDNGTITSTLENQRINQLPLNGRVLATLLSMTTPGYEGSSAGGTRLNGLSGEALEFVADGVPMVNRQFGGTNTSNSLTPDPDSVQEVRAVTDNGGAEYATPGTVVITTKSGTNSLHGALFETARNNAIGIAKNRNNPSNFSAPKYIRNEWGMSAGGPIILPHVYHGKDKSFWFLSYERYSLASGSTAQFQVLTPANRSGDFSDLLADTASKPQLYDPATTHNDANCNGTGQANQFCRAPFPNDVIPAGRQSPTSKILNDIEPLPNLPFDPFEAANLQGPNPSFTVIPTWTFRLDHVFNDNNRAYLRYTSNVNVNTGLRNYPSNEPATLAADGLPAYASGGAYNPTANFAGALGYTHVFSPSFFAETILSQQWESQHNFAMGTPLANYEKILGLPNNFGEGGFPQIGPFPSVGGQSNGTSSLIRSLDGTQFIYGLSQILSTLDENLTKTVGKHQMQFGGRYRHERFGYLPDEVGDTVNFSSQATGLEDPTTGTNYGVTSNTGNVNADEFLGAGNSYSVQLNLPYEHYHDMEFDAYFQDNYHMTRNLTWNIGLRYEAHPATWVKYGAMESFDLKNHALVLASPPSEQIARGMTTQAIITNLANIGVKLETPQEAGLPPQLVDNYNLNFLPRVAFAYQPFGGKYGTVLRGGYGRYIFPIPVRTSYKDEMRQVPHGAGYSQNYSLAAQSPDKTQNYLIRNATFPVQGINTTNIVDSTSTTAILPGIGLYTITPNEAPDFVTQLNFTVEQPLKGNSALRVSWLWTHGTNLDQEYHYNNPYSTFTWELLTGTKPPKGTTIGSPTYQATALGPYDQTVWGNSILDQKSGWSNDNQLQVNYQRLFHNGLAYQIFYDWSQPFRVGGNYFRDGVLYTGQAYVSSGQGTIKEYPNESPITAPVMPPARPAGIASYAYWHQLDVYQDYIIDTSVPRQAIQFNALLDLPFGRGKHYLSGVNHFMNEVVGGWEVAGDGTFNSQDFYVSNGNWGPTNPIHVYKSGHKVTDCRSGKCATAYEWFNGYVAPSQLPSSGCTAVVNGLPSGWTPYSQPLDTNYNPTAPCGKAQDSHYNTNDVQLNLLDGSTDNQGYAPGPSSTNPWRKTLLNGPNNFVADLSVFKVFPIKETTVLRFNMDTFNVLNMQGLNNPGSGDGVLQFQPQFSSSHNTPRQVQLTLRLEF